ncbi:hypothetical protein EV138_2756 [Kribbella voronezhensis]|uniref:DUF4386 family protein n=1 Tax=Kribbella voronezhensis TaxID=2512212 RepID=A0A4R7TCK2_9ACTN|nr:hypothetical protein [Kribbella voronezhensis]TDU89196.1 hypothetical protein EV138_2756 [Kribbella voronezhensis]
MADGDELAVRGTPLARIVGATGLVGTLLLFATLIGASPGEPAINATTAEAATYVRGLDTTWVRLAEAGSDIGMFVLLWFMVGLALLLRRVDGEVPLRSTMALVSAVLVAAFVILETGDAAGANRAADLDPGQLAYAYDLSHLGFANAWLAMAGFAFACGWIITSTRVMPRWLGRWGVISGIALAPAQFLWTIEGAWLLPYVAFWLWLITTAVVLVRRNGFVLPEKLAEGI